MTKAIEVRHLAKEFQGKKVLKNLNFTINKGEIFGFLGPSGAGKTTTIKILTKQLLPTHGDIMIMGAASTGENNILATSFGVVSDNSGLYEKNTCYDNLKLFADIWGIPHTRIDVVLKQVLLYEDKNKKVERLSKGMKQCLILARSILHKPSIIFLDEPTSGLDPTTAIEIHQLIASLQKEGVTIFLTTHNMEEARKLCTRIAFIYQGEITEIGTPEGIIEKYAAKKQVKVKLCDGKVQTINLVDEQIGQLVEWMKSDQLISIHSIEKTLEEIFVEVTGGVLS